MKAMEVASGIACSIYKTMSHKLHLFPHFVGLEIPQRENLKQLFRNYICQSTLSL